MSQAYRAVGWNRQKRRYDATIAAGVAAYLVVFAGGGLVLDAEATAETLLIRACGTAALFLLHVVLSIGPLCRMDRRFLPLLYNRRHLGVTTFLLAAVHGGFALVQFHALGDVNPFASVLVTSRSYGSLADFPFQQLGLAALAILFTMAATSHDFWLRTLTAPIWKTLHMLVYLAYALVVAHVSLGALQAERSAVLPTVLLAGVAVVAGLHLRAAALERRGDREQGATASAGFVDVCAVSEIPDRRAKTVCLAGERVAVFKYDGRVSAVSNVCRHQNGPLGEGRIVDGCIVCPWHGYEYAPADGCAPAPFTEKLPTFAVKVVDGRVLVDPTPNPAGTFVAPALLTSVLPSGSREPGAGSREPSMIDDFYIGYGARMAPGLARRIRAAAGVLLALAVLLPALLLAAQSRFAAGVFEFGRLRTVEGRLVEFPYPAIDVSGASPASYWLVGAGKHGAATLVSGLDGRLVRLRGTRIERDGERMLQVAADGIEILASAGETKSSAPVPIRTVTVAGELVDSKCHLGVMKPGEGPLHRDCAVRCLLGAVPPMISVRGAGVTPGRLALVHADGRPFFSDFSALAGRPLTIRGTLARQGARSFLAVSLDDIKIIR